MTSIPNHRHRVALWAALLAAFLCSLDAAAQTPSPTEEAECRTLVNRLGAGFQQRFVEAVCQGTRDAKATAACANRYRNSSSDILPQCNPNRDPFARLTTPVSTPDSTEVPTPPAKPTRVMYQLPQYVVAHRCNAGTGAVQAIQQQGVNAIEADFRYHTGESRWYLAHDNISDTSERLDSWLREVTKARPQLLLLQVDIKTPDGPLGELYDQLRASLPGVGLMFDFGNVSNGSGLASVKSKILADELAVAAMGFDDSPAKVDAFFQAEGVPRHKYWYEWGLNAGMVWSDEETKWAEGAIATRDAGNGSKVVIWTFEKEQTVKDWLAKGIDAILVNSSHCFGRTTAWATDADVHVRNARARTGYYGEPGTNPFR